MNTLPITQNTYNASHNPWGSGELPPGPPMSLDSPFVKSLELMWPEKNLAELSKHAPQLCANMMKMFSSQIAHDLKKARERARKMKEAIL